MTLSLTLLESCCLPKPWVIRRAYGKRIIERRKVGLVSSRTRARARASHRMLTSYYACGLGFATLLVAWPAMRMLARVVVLGPIFAVLIWGEQKLSSCFALRFPRSLSELLANPRAFFGLLQRQVGVHPALRDPPVLPAGAQMESCSRLRELTTEVRTCVCHRLWCNPALLLPRPRSSPEPLRFHHPAAADDDDDVALAFSTSQ